MMEWWTIIQIAVTSSDSKKSANAEKRWLATLFSISITPTG